MKSFYDNFSPRPQDPQDTEYEGEYGGEYGGDYGEDYYYGESGNLQINVFCMIFINELLGLFLNYLTSQI